MINASTAFALFGILAVLAFFTLDGQPRLVALAVIGLFAVRVYLTILRRRQRERQESEAGETGNPNPPVVS